MRLELNSNDSVDQVYYTRRYFIKELRGIAGLTVGMENRSNKMKERVNEH